MILADDLIQTQYQDKDGNWHVCKPISPPFLTRLFLAWKVLKGDYVAVKFWSER